MALCSSHTLTALVAELRERAVAGEPQKSIIGCLASLVKGLGIKMRTDKCTAPQFLDLGGLPPKSRGRQVAVVMNAGCCGSNSIQNRGLHSLSRSTAAAVAVCAPSATGS